ncbi:hypothetical protein Trco_008261 [Trichoderma cornu-damae]|uniref:Uncharacterized protein n=1 Tax=Trichoderma cornu-damae TaxID=654480 RepID=A0A9P8TRD1_9HYPO|nr:hypothetical protein Trco_008261 [Trichoderma cornu-damae]
MKLLRRFSRPLLFCLIPLVKAYTVFETTCSAPAAPANYVSSPNTRGTLDIIWSSLFTIIACTWTLQHPNIPEQRNGRDKGHLGDAKWALRAFYRGAARMACTVIAPELIIGAAFGDLLAARQSREEMKGYAEEDGVTWSLIHGYYANMGGFIIRSKPGGGGGGGGGKAYHDPYHVDAYAIYRLRLRNHLPRLPDVSVDEIQDMSKGDALVKTIAVGQILWTVLQVIARAARGLPVSPLEIAVVAFAACAVIIYGLYWSKPQRACATRTILEYAEEIPAEVLETLAETHYKAYILKQFFMIPNESHLPGSPVGTNSDNTRDVRGTVSLFFSGIIGAATFGGIHVTAWNFAFPSTVDAIFWRCASVYSAAFPLCFLLCFVLAALIEFSDDILAILILLFNCLYVVARLIILVEIVRTLFYLPPGSFVSTWTTNIPHIA